MWQPQGRWLWFAWTGTTQRAIPIPDELRARFAEILIES